MSARSFQPTIIIPTKNRADVLSQLLNSIEQLDAIDGIRPEIIVADNDSQDDTYERINARTGVFARPSAPSRSLVPESRPPLMTP